MLELNIKDWIFSDDIPLISKITETDDDYYHKHDFYEIFYILNGNIIHNLNGKKETLSTGDIRLLTPNDSHGFIREKNNHCQHRDIVISKEQFKKSCDYIDANLLNKINLRKIISIAKISNQKITELENFFSKIYFTLTNNNKKSMINVLIIDLISTFLQIPEHNFYPSWINSILPLFSTPITMKLGVEYIIKDLNYDRSYMCRTFKKYIGCSMSIYLRNKRIEYSSFLLLTTDKTIQQICDDIGFESIPYFISAFKNTYKITPKQFKLQYNKVLKK